MKRQLCWCAFHKTLICYVDYVGRIDIIEEFKPKNEVPTRLYELRVVKGKLPWSIKRACKKYIKAAEIYDAAYPCNARGALKEINIALLLMREKIKKHKDYLEKLHKEEVPDTVWDGNELVFPSE